MKKVILIGYMGSGKSVISLELSENLVLQQLDLDELIEKKANLSIKNIFKNKGELFFRKLENEIFRNVLEKDESFILSTGGGTPCYYDNYKLLNYKNCVSIYLKASIETLYNRLLNEKENRPLISSLNDNEIKEYISKHLFERSFYYNKATNVINVDNKTISEIVKEIIKLLA